jgi:predicted Zn-dependent protease with MMP-like domain
MDRDEFEKLVAEAIAALPLTIRQAFDNVGFVIEDRARRQKAAEVGIRVDEVLLGLYEGVPKIERGSWYGGVLPDKITIFRQPIEELAGGDAAELQELVCEVVWHEIGHHLGFNERQLRALEKKRGRRRSRISH